MLPGASNIPQSDQSAGCSWGKEGVAERLRKDQVPPNAVSSLRQHVQYGGVTTGWFMTTSAGREARESDTVDQAFRRLAQIPGRGLAARAFVLHWQVGGGLLQALRSSWSRP